VGRYHHKSGGLHALLHRAEAMARDDPRDIDPRCRRHGLQTDTNNVCNLIVDVVNSIVAQRKK
jgi:hypothetical protein